MAKIDLEWRNHFRNRHTPTQPPVLNTAQLTPPRSHRAQVLADERDLVFPAETALSYQTNMNFMAKIDIKWSVSIENKPTQPQNSTLHNSRPLGRIELRFWLRIAPWLHRV